MTNKITQAERAELTAYAHRLMVYSDATPVQAALQARTEISPARAFGYVASAMRQIRNEQRRAT